MNTTLLSNGEIKKALFDSYEEAQDYDDKGELFPEKHVARKQDLHTKSLLADEVRKIDCKELAGLEIKRQIEFGYEPSYEDMVIAGLQAVLKLIEAKK
jgi:hypothetical protein